MNQYSALVFGGTRGIGFEITKMFHRNQVPVVFTGTKLSQVKKIESSFDSDIVYGAELDLACLYSIRNFKNKINSMGFRPNIMVYNAGYLSLRSNEKDVNVQKLFQINTISPVILCSHFLPHMIKTNNGHFIFNSPPYVIDDKVKFLTPYLQSKLGQTTFMKSLSHIVKDYNISCNSIWTDYPLWTDAIKLRNVGKKEQCVHPSILSRVVEEIVWQENPKLFKGNEIIDETYLRRKNIDTSSFFLGDQVQKLDHLFMSHLTSKKK